MTSKDRKLPATPIKSTSDGFCKANKSEVVNLKTNCMEKTKKTVMTNKERYLLFSVEVFNIIPQSKKGLTIKKTIKTNPIIILSRKNVVLVYVLARTVLSNAIASANLFLNPLHKPISKSENQLIIELIVSHNP
jgi:hypothetical protein